MDRPLCKCHGEPMVRMGRQMYGDRKLKWACGQNRRSHAHAEYLRFGRKRRQMMAADRKSEGLCVRCGREPLLGDALCWTCLSYMEEHRAVSF